MKSDGKRTGERGVEDMQEIVGPDSNSGPCGEAWAHLTGGPACSDNIYPRLDNSLTVILCSNSSSSSAVVEFFPRAYELFKGRLRIDEVGGNGGPESRAHMLEPDVCRVASRKQLTFTDDIYTHGFILGHPSACLIFSVCVCACASVCGHICVFV